MPSLILQGLTRRYGGVTAIDDVNLALNDGEFVVVIGPSGAGKSTLLRLINRLVEPSEGSIVADGVDITRLRGKALCRWRAQAPMIFQHFNLAPRLDSLTNVLVGRMIETSLWRRALGAFSRSDQLRAFGVLHQLGLADRAFERVERLSGGQQQRIAIARALVHQPKLILADEPVASLDPRNAELVMQTLRKVNRERGIAVVCNLHSVDLAKRYADRIIAIRAGRVQFDDAPHVLTPGQVRSIYEGDAEADEDIQPRFAAVGG